MRGLVVLGATGTVGRNTLDVAARHPQRLRVLGLSAHTDDAGLFELCQAHQVPLAALVDVAAAARLRERAAVAGYRLEVLEGVAGLNELAGIEAADTVMAAIVGSAGLLPTLAAVDAGKRVLLATKEALVMAGAWFVQRVRARGASLVPIDSEHNAVFQCLPSGTECGRRPAGLRRIILTASGGPFRNWTLTEMAKVTPAEAVAHPNWTMGQKISVDSATMMNKGLEFIEAVHLFALDAAEVDIVVHPQSTVHSLVEYVDGSFLAQLGAADMRIPIAHALAMPERWESGAASLNFSELARLDFEAPDPQRFPSLRLAREALAAGGPAPAVLNAANEAAVASFLNQELSFPGISATVATCLDRAVSADLPAIDSIEGVLAVDAWARQQAQHAIGGGHA